MATNNTLFSSMVRAGRVTYFVDVKETKNGKKYMVISETNIDTDLNKSRSVIRVFAETAALFGEAVSEAVTTMGSSQGT